MSDGAPSDYLDVEAIGAQLRIEFAPGMPDELRARVLDAWTGAIAPVEVADAVVRVEPGFEAEAMLERLSIRVTLAALERRRGELVMIHAAGIAMDDGRVVAFVGPSGRGKTTLSATLGAHFGYVSDETIAVDDDLIVWAYRKPLSMVRAGRPKKQVSPHSAGLLELPAGPLRLAALVLLDRRPHMAEPVLSRIPVIDAITELVPQLSYLADLEAPLQRLARLCDAVGGVWRVTYQEAESLISLVPQLLRASPENGGAWKALPPNRSEVQIRTTEFSLGEVSDTIAAGGQVAVIKDGVFRVLDGIAPSIWRGVSAGLSFEHLVAQVVTDYDQPPNGDPSKLVAAAIDELVREGLIVKGSEPGK